MDNHAATGAHSRAHRIQQAIKWTVYTLLIINFVYYILEDWDRARHSLDAGSSVIEWAREFATTIDESAWFILLAMFELETYVLEDREWKGWIGHTVRGIRLFCYVMIAHTVYAYAVSVISLQPTVPVENVSSLCDLANDDVSYVYNLDYTRVNPATCAELSTAAQFYWLGDDPIVSDLPGLELERDLAWADLIEAITWLIIVVAIEIVVRLQDKRVAGGALISALNKLQIVLYLLLIAIGIYWATLSHWLYFWDELVWIGGFAAIEMNIAEWRGELLETEAAT